MKASNIETMMLSVSSPSVGFLDERSARVRLARTINKDFAQTLREHPGRFGGFATLLLPHASELLTESDYAFDELGLDGVIVETNTDGEYLGDPSVAPILALIPQ